MQITLIFPHQLFADHPALQPGRSVVLLEDPLLFGTDPRWPLRVHLQRLLLHRASITAYVKRLRDQGFEVRHRPHHLAATTEEHLLQLWQEGVRSFHLVDPVDDLLDKRLTTFCRERQCGLELLPTPMLLTHEVVSDLLRAKNLDGPLL